MRVLTLALGGCLKAPPVAYGLTEDTGGHIAYVLGAARALAATSGINDVEIVTRRFDDPALGPEYAVACEPMADNLRIVRIDSGNRAYLAKEALAADRAAFTAALIRHLSDQPRLPDVIHAHFADAADVAIAVRERFGIPFVYTAHSLGIDKAATGSVAGGAEPGLAARIAEERRAIRGADAIVASSRDECERQLPAYGPVSTGRIHRLRPGIDHAEPTAADLAATQALLAPFLRDPSRPIVLAVARPVRKKNLLGLVKAFATSSRLRATANLVILAGLREGLANCRGEQREVMDEIVDAIDRYDLHGQVAWPRRHTHAQVGALYALARRSRGVFVNPALNEPYGLTLIEAASHGLPVVATDSGGPRDIVAELEHGLLVDPRSTPAIARAIERVLTDPMMWAGFSANARRRSAEMTWESYATGFANLARRITGKAPAPSERPRRLLLSDIDNTLTGCRVGAGRLARYLNRHARSTAFGVATGRAFTDARRLLLEWGLPEPEVIVASVGTEIYWREADGYRRDRSFDASITYDWDAEAVDDLLRRDGDLQPQASGEQHAFKRSYFSAADVAERVRATLAQAGLKARVIHSHGRFLDVLPLNAGKAAAMRHVARAMGLPCERVIAAGDSGNDADMLAACPGAVVVANHDRDLAEVIGLAHVYRASRAHAGGVLEGLLRHVRRPPSEVFVHVAA